MNAKTLPKNTPSVEHEARVDLLEDLARLLGCHVLIRSLPDGKRPDVFSIDFRQAILFLGESKESEGPTDIASRARLDAYLRWVAAHASRNNSVCIIAIACGRRSHAHGWAQTLTQALCELSIEGFTVRTTAFKPGEILVWAEVRGAPTQSSSAGSPARIEMSLKNVTQAVSGLRIGKNTKDLCEN